MKIRLQKIEKDFGEGALFAPFDAEFLPDQVYVIHGVSGCGKSTLLSLIGLIDYPSNGSIYFDEKDYASASNEKRNDFRRRNISFFFQGGNLFQELSLEDNLACVCSDKGSVDKTLQHFGLRDIQHQHAKYCSRGEQQRAGICRVMLENKPVALFDEPTASLDPENRKIFYDSLDEFRKGRIVFIVSHKYKTEEDRPFLHHLYFEEGRITCPEKMDSGEKPFSQIQPKEKNRKLLKKHILSKEFSKGALLGLIYFAVSSLFGYAAGTSASYLPITPDGTKTQLMEQLQTRTLPFADQGAVPSGIVYRAIDMARQCSTDLGFQLFYTNDPAIEKHEKDTGRVMVSSALSAALAGSPLSLFDSAFPVEIDRGIPLTPKNDKYAIVSLSLLSLIDAKSATEINVNTMGDLGNLFLHSGTSVKLDRTVVDANLSQGEISLSVTDAALNLEALLGVQGKTYRTFPETRGKFSTYPMSRLFDQYTIKTVETHPLETSAYIFVRLSEADHARIDHDLLRFFPYAGTDAYYRYIPDCPASEIKPSEVKEYWGTEGSQLHQFESYLTAYINILIPVFVVSSLFSIGFALLYVLNLCKSLNARIQLAEAIGWDVTPFFLWQFLLLGLVVAMPFEAFSFVGFGHNILPNLGYYGYALSAWVGAGTSPWPASLILLGQFLVSGIAIFQERKSVSSRLASSIKISRELEDEGI